jgi:hypothetical protein
LLLFLLSMNLLAQFPVLERRLHIHVVHLPLELSSDGEQKPDGVQARDRGKDLIEVDPRTLDIALCDEPGLVLEDDAIGVALQLVDPL